MVKNSIILMIGLLFILGSFISAVAQAQDVGGSIDHPVIQRLPDYYIWSYEAKKFDQHKFHTADGYVLKKGYKSHIQYSIEQGKSGHSSSQIISNYIEDIKKKGGEALYEDNASTTLLLKTDDNETWIEIIAQWGSYYVTIVEQKETRYSVADKTVSTSVLQKQYPGVITQKKDYMELESSIFLRPPLVTYYVSAGADEGGNGTREHPFRTIGQALDNAENFNAMEVQIYLSDGTYPGDLLITRLTNITGEGEDTDIRGRISNSNFKLTLKRLKISYATNRAIHQVGGTLDMEECSIFNTRLVEGDLGSGRAIDLSGGAKAVLRDVTLNSNEGQALLLSGEGTKVTGSNIQVRHNRVNPEAHSQATADNVSSLIGAIEVAEGAKLLLEDFFVDDNESQGVLVHNFGLAHLRRGTISHTKTPSGDNLAMFRGARVEVHNLILNNAASCGIRVFCSYLKVYKVEFIENSIAIAFQSPPESSYNLMDCLYEYPDNIIMENNGLNFDSTELPVPYAIEDPDDADSYEGPYCPGVPWE